MPLESPISFTAALASRQVKTALPTTASSAQLMQLAPAEWLKFLLAVAGAAGIVASIGLTMVKQKRERRQDKPAV